ncbi:unnamed protein product, partial [Symbiodinium sp. CCMP2592]
MKCVVLTSSGSIPVVLDGPLDPRFVDWKKTDYELFRDHLPETCDDLFEDAQGDEIFELSSSSVAGIIMPARKTKGVPMEKEPEEEEEVVEPPTEVTDKKKPKKPASSGSGLAESLRRGVALAKLRKTMDVPCKPGELIPECTMLLEDGSCDLTIKDLMVNDSLSYEDAIRVMIQLRAEAEPSTAPNTNPCPDKSKPKTNSTKPKADTEVPAAGKNGVKDSGEAEEVLQLPSLKGGSKQKKDKNNKKGKVEEKALEPQAGEVPHEKSKGMIARAPQDEKVPDVTPKGKAKRKEKAMEPQDGEVPQVPPKGKAAPKETHPTSKGQAGKAKKGKKALEPEVGEVPHPTPKGKANKAKRGEKALDPEVGEVPHPTPNGKAGKAKREEKALEPQVGEVPHPKRKAKRGEDACNEKPAKEEGGKKRAAQAKEPTASKKAKTNKKASEEPRDKDQEEPRDKDQEEPHEKDQEEPHDKDQEEPRDKDQEEPHDKDHTLEGETADCDGLSDHLEKLLQEMDDDAPAPAEPAEPAVPTHRVRIKRSDAAIFGSPDAKAHSEPSTSESKAARKQAKKEARKAEKKARKEIARNKRAEEKATHDETCAEKESQEEPGPKEVSRSMKEPEETMPGKANAKAKETDRPQKAPEREREWSQDRQPDTQDGGWYPSCN